MSWILLEYQCPCGARIESLESRSAPSGAITHPACGGRAERCLSAVRGSVKVSVTTGKGETPPADYLPTSLIADGMSHNEWRARRKEVRAKKRYSEIKAMVS